MHTDINPMYTLVRLRFTEVCRLAVLTYWGDDGLVRIDLLAEKGRPGPRKKSCQAGGRACPQPAAHRPLLKL